MNIHFDIHFVFLFWNNNVCFATYTNCLSGYLSLSGLTTWSKLMYIKHENAASKLQNSSDLMVTGSNPTGGVSTFMVFLILNTFKC